MPLYLLIILFSCFTLIFTIYSKWQFSDDRGESTGKWHSWGAALRATSVITCLLLSLFPTDWRDIFVAGMIQLPVWDIGINIIALHVKAFYLGGTAKTDQLKGKKWLLMGVGIIISIIIKSFVHICNQDLIELFKHQN